MQRMEKVKLAEIEKQLEAENKKVVKKWEYLFNYWSPIVALLTFLIAGVLWYSKADARMFSTPEMKIKTEEHVNETDPITIDKLQEKFVDKEEYNKDRQVYLDIVKENQKDIKEILRYERKEKKN